MMRAITSTFKKRAVLNCLAVSRMAPGTLRDYAGGRMMVMDHHQTTPHGNLWTQIDLGRGDFAWVNNVRGSTQDEVYWNVRAGKPLAYPDVKLRNVVVGLAGRGEAVQNPARPWVENIDTAKLSPPNLFRAQLEKRIGTVAAAKVLDPD